MPVEQRQFGEAMQIKMVFDKCGLAARSFSSHKRAR
jgi:hypothetical protein